MMKKILKITTALTFVLIALGGVVRNNGAGLSCPDWPLCNGQWIPPMDTLVLLEWTHRLIASSVGFLTLGLVITIGCRKKYRQQLGGFAFLAFALLAVQVVLGGLTVTEMLKPMIVTWHLATGIAFFATLLWMFLRQKSAALPGVVENVSDYPKVCPTPNRLSKIANQFNVLTVACLGSRTPFGVGHSFSTTPLPECSRYILVRRVAGGLAGLVYMQIVLGGLVSSNHAGLVCPDFPTCLGHWIPPLSQSNPQLAQYIKAYGWEN